MRLLCTECEELKVDTYNDERKLPKYAILSHTWLAAEEEITLQDIGKEGILSDRAGWKKLDYARKQALKDGYSHVWIDTCCIDKTSSVELAEAINSMYRWYSLAEVCYVYLADMPDSTLNDESKPRPPDWQRAAYGQCKWFKRGWTLQEMLAPAIVRFYSKSWTPLGTLSELADTMAHITGIHIEALQRKWPPTSYSIAQRMSWAANRETTKIEDRAYSLLGIFELNIPIIYGEGERAFARLQEELLKLYADQSIFSWLAFRPRDEVRRHLNLLANSPEAFRSCGRVLSTEQDNFDLIRIYELKDKGIKFSRPTRPIGRKAVVDKVLRADFYPETMIAALRCRYEDDPGQILGADMSPIINTPWNRETQRTVMREFNVSRVAHQAQDRPPRQNSSDTVIVCPNLKSSSMHSEQLSIVSAEPAAFWNHQSSSFLMSQDSCKSFQGQKFVGRVFFRLKTPFDARDSFALSIRAVRVGLDWQYTLGVEQTANTSLHTFKHDAFVSAARIPIHLPGRFYWAIARPEIGNVKVMPQISRITVCVDAETDLPLFIFIPFRFIVRFFASALLPLVFILPVVVFMWVRRQAYLSAHYVEHTHSTTGADFMEPTYEDIALISALLAWLISIGLLLKSKLYRVWVPRSWRWPMLWLLRTVSCLLSQIVHGLLVESYHGTTFDDSLVSLMRDRYSALYPFVLLESIAMMFMTEFNNSKGDTKQLMANARLMRIAIPGIFKVVFLVPLLVHVYKHNSTAVPWNDHACLIKSRPCLPDSWKYCRQHNIPPSSAAIYARDARYAPSWDRVTREELCQRVAYASKLLWSIVALGVYETALECLALWQEVFSEPRSAHELAARRNILQKFADYCRPWLRHYRGQYHEQQDWEAAGERS